MRRGLQRRALRSSVRTELAYSKFRACDVIELLNWLPEGDRWSELIWFAPRRKEGEKARAAALPMFARMRIPRPRCRLWLGIWSASSNYTNVCEAVRGERLPVYMGRAHEVLPAEERIAAWIGEDLQADALAGFEVFLTANPPHAPSAIEIAESNAKSRIWHAALILSAALAERQRVGRDFADLSTERVQAGLFAERVAAITATASSGHP
jgi:hypothetical protein